MAREYSLLYQLNAQMNSSFSSTFKTAQSEIARFREEYRSLSTTANDISGYQRQQAAVEKTKSKLEHLQTQYDNIQREMDESGNFSSDLANKQDRIKEKIEQTSKAYEEQVRKMEEYKQALERAGVDTTDLDKELQRLRDELKRLKEGFKEGGEGAKQFGDEGKSSLENVASALEAAGIVAGLKKIYDVLASCVRVAADFEESMSNVEAISGATGEDLDALTTRAKELGASTAFTAQQVSEGMSYMAMAGWKTNDMLAGMDAVLALAAASGEDLGTTSDIVTDALTAFGLKASDTARFADVLAAASSNANTNVGMMGETFKYAAPVAGALGYSIEDVAVVTGLMANSGIKASQAGTTLRNIFNGLLGGVDLTSKAFGEAHVSFENANGTMKDLSSSIDVLRGYFEQMTEAERVHNAINIAGQRGYSGLLAILNSTTEDYNKLTDAINNSSGAAQKMADIKLDNLNGQMTIAKSAAEGLEIAVGETLTPTLQDMYGSFADVLGGMTQFIKNNPAVVKGIAGVTAGIGVFVIAITAAKVAMAAFNAVAMMNPFVLFISGAIALSVALGTLASALEEERIETVEYTATTKAHAKELIEMREEYSRVCEEQGEASEQAKELRVEIEVLSDEYERSKKSVEEYRAEVQRLHDSHEEIDKRFSESTRSLDDEYSSTIALIEKLEVLGSDSQMAARNQALIVPVIEELNERYGDLGLTFDALTGRFNMTTDEIREVATATFDAQKAQQDWDEYVKKSGLASQQEKSLEEAQTELDLLTESYNSAYKTADDYTSSFLYYLSLIGGNTEGHALWDTAHKAEDAMNTQKENVAQLNAAYNETTDRLKEIEEEYGWVGDAAEATGNAFITSEDAIDQTISAATDEINTLCEAYNAAKNAARESIDKQIGLFDEMVTKSELTSDQMISNLQSQVTYLTTYATNLRLAAEYGISDGLIAALSDGSTESAGYINQIVSDIQSLGPTTDAAKQYVENFNNSFAAVDEAKDTWSETVGKMQADFDDKMTGIEERMQQAITDMTLETEAENAARETISAYVQAIRNGTDDAVQAAKDAAAAVAAALGGSDSGYVKPDSSGYIPQFDILHEGYAGGTDYATSGAHLVGENGPELVLFHGGEQVLNTTRTAQLLGSRGYTVSFAPVYQISGSVNSDELMDVLTAHDEALKEQLLDLLDEAQTDRVRRRYS